MSTTRTVNPERFSFAELNLRGRAGQDGILKYTASGKPILSFSVAVNKGPKENRRTIWLTVKAFGDLAESAEVRKGDLLDVQGSLDISTWQDKTTGSPRERAEVLANEITLHKAGSFQTAPRDVFEDAEDIPF
jgi:single stranded DNA-binding protein